MEKADICRNAIEERNAIRPLDAGQAGACYNLLLDSFVTLIEAKSSLSVCQLELVKLQKPSSFVSWSRFCFQMYLSGASWMMLFAMVPKGALRRWEMRLLRLVSTCAGRAYTTSAASRWIWLQRCHLAAHGLRTWKVMKVKTCPQCRRLLRLRAQLPHLLLMLMVSPTRRYRAMSCQLWWCMLRMQLCHEGLVGGRVDASTSRLHGARSWKAWLHI